MTVKNKTNIHLLVKSEKKKKKIQKDWMEKKEIN